MEWLFEGLGTEIIMFVVGLLTGGPVGYRIGVRKSQNLRNKQNAKARDNTTQIQIGNVNNGRQ